MKELRGDKEGQCVSMCVCVCVRAHSLVFGHLYSIHALLFIRLFIPTLSHDFGAGAYFTVCYHGDALPEL